MPNPGTERPSARRLRDARQRGNVPRSPLLSAWAVWLGLALVVRFQGPAWFASTSDWMAASLARIAEPAAAMDGLLEQEAGRLWVPLVALLLAVFATATLVELAQIGPLVAWGALGSERMRAPTGARTLLLRLCMAALALSIAWLAGAYVATDQRVVDPLQPFGSVAETGGVIAPLAAFSLSFLSLLALAAAVDLVSVRAEHWRALFLHRSDARREQRETEGAPELKRARMAARRRAQPASSGGAQ